MKGLSVMSFNEMSTDNGPESPATKGFVLGPDEGEAFWWLGSLSINKLTGSQARNGLDIVDHRVPAGYSPPLHVHSQQDEVFFVIDGDFAVHCGGDEWQAGPGSLVFLPRLVPHGFVVSDAGPGRTLLINAPAGFAEVVSELGEPAPGLVLPPVDLPMPDPARIAAVSQAHGIHNP
jgi:mannose-6-phosphate isomerase-like protein (cupin superfamily)